MVFTLGKWSFSNKPGKVTSYSTQGSNLRLGLQVQRLNSQHTCHWGAARGLFTESAPRSTKHQAKLTRWLGDLSKNNSPVGARPREGTGENRFSSGPRSQALGRNSGNALALTEKTWRVTPLQIWNNVNDFSELSVQLHWVIWNLWFMN